MQYVEIYLTNMKELFKNLTIKYEGATEVKGSTVALYAPNACYGEKVIFEINDTKRYGQVIAITNDIALVQVFEGTNGFSLNNTTSTLTGMPYEINLSEEILGRTFNAVGDPRDGLNNIKGIRREVNNTLLNPITRVYPKNFIQTGISAIDLLTTLIRGQKLPIFSDQGLPHNKLIAQIIAQATIPNNEEDNYIVFAGIGLSYDTYTFFKESFASMGNANNVITFLNLANEPVAERLLIPRVALTAAEYLAYDLGKHVLVIMTDMTSYCEALREQSSTKGEMPGRRGYPSYMYSDLSTIYERAGIHINSSGSVTLIPVLTMPGGDISHPIPDLTGFITEGQIVLDKSLKVYPPINILPSLSRLMKDGIGEGKTVKNHEIIAKEIFEAYGKVGYLRDLAQIIGVEELSKEDRKYLKFGEEIEQTLIQQQITENRSIHQTIVIAKRLLSLLSNIQEEDE